MRQRRGDAVVNSFLMINVKCSAMTGVLYVVGPCERQLTEEIHIPLRPTPKEDTLCRWCFYK